MLWRRLLPCVLAGLLATDVLRAQSVNLTEAPLDQQCVRNELTLELEGKVLSRQNGKELSFPHKATAKHVFVERFLGVSGGIVDKAARFYSAAEGTIRFNNNEASRRSLRDEHRLLVAQRVRDQIVSFSPKGALTRAEMEVTEHLDTLALPGLLPGKMTEVGKSWTIPNRVVAALCELDGLTEQNLEGKLEGIKLGRAFIKIVGQAKGINLGAQVGMIVNARLEFDVKEKRIVFVEWKETDSRQQGPVSPAMNADLTILLTRTPIAEPAELNKFALVPVPTAETPPANLTNIQHLDTKKRFELSYARDWHVVSPDDSPQLVLRQLERGEFIAQATFTVWKKTDAKTPMKLDDFAALVAKTPGWVEEKEIERKQIDNKGGQTIYRVASSGELDGTRTVQYYYLIASPRGDQLIVTFSVVPQHVQRLGSRDLEMVREIAFP
jgi:hypothetical protein